VDSKVYPRQSHTSRSDEDEINADECAICFKTYNDDILELRGEAWIECVCGRWVHDNCVDHHIVSS